MPEVVWAQPTHWVAAAAAALYRAYHATLRVRVLWPDGTTSRPDAFPIGRQIFALCEQDTLTTARLVADSGCTVLVTIGRDGDRAGAVLQQLGCRIVRGSSRHGGAAALKGLLDTLAVSEGPAAIVVDGPLGPPGQAKSGAIACGMMSGRPIHALAAAARRRVVFRGTWSGLYLPLPFTRVVIAVDEPLRLEEPSDPGRADAHAERLSRRLRDLRDRARDAVGSGVPPTGSGDA